MEKKIIEVNGVKMEVDFRTAEVQQVDTYKVGDSVKVLTKEYSDSYRSHAGVIVGFDNFPTLPTLIIATVEDVGYEPKITFVYFNAESNNVQVCKANEHDIPFKKEDVLNRIAADIAKKQREIEDLIQKREYFLKHFSKYFEKTHA